VPWVNFLMPPYIYLCALQRYGESSSYPRGLTFEDGVSSVGLTKSPESRSLSVSSGHRTVTHVRWIARGILVLMSILSLLSLIVKMLDVF